MFARVYIILNKRARALLPLLICAGLFCYFSLNFAGGKYGLDSRDRLQVRVTQLSENLSSLQKQRQQFEQRIALLQQGYAKKDLVDELARKYIQYASPKDLVLFD